MEFLTRMWSRIKSSALIILTLLIIVDVGVIVYGLTHFLSGYVGFGLMVLMLLLALLEHCMNSDSEPKR